MRRVVQIAVATVVVGGIVFALVGASAIAGGQVAPSGLPSISIAMDGKSIAVHGALVSGAVDIHSTVTHEPFGAPTLIRLNPVDAAAAPGTSHSQTRLDAGNYVALDTAKGKPPFPNNTLTIAQASESAALPPAKAVESAIDCRFRGPTVLRNGELGCCRRERTSRRNTSRRRRSSRSSNLFPTAPSSRRC